MSDVSSYLPSSYFLKIIINSISVHPLLLMNVMFDFICMDNAKFHTCIATHVDWYSKVGKPF